MINKWNQYRLNKTDMYIGSMYIGSIIQKKCTGMDSSEYFSSVDSENLLNFFCNKSLWYLIIKVNKFLLLFKACAINCKHFLVKFNISYVDENPNRTKSCIMSTSYFHFLFSAIWHQNHIKVFRKPHIWITSQNSHKMRDVLFKT